MNCEYCGAALPANANNCPACGAAVAHPVTTTTASSTMSGQGAGSKSKVAAGILGILVGCWGVHNFYLGNTNRAIIQLLLGTVGGLAFGIGPFISMIWGLVEGIKILTGSISTDAKGNPLV